MCSRNRRPSHSSSALYTMSRSFTTDAFGLSKNKERSPSAKKRWPRTCARSSKRFSTRPRNAASGDSSKTNCPPLWPSYMKGSVPRMIAGRQQYRRRRLSRDDNPGDAAASTTSPYSKMLLAYPTSPYSASI